MTFVSSVPDRAARRPQPSRLMTAAVMITAVACFVAIANRIIEVGYVRLDIAALEAGDVWRNGGWLSQLLLSSVAFIPSRPLRQVLLSLAAAAGTGVLLGILFDRLRRTGWSAVGAVFVVLALGSNLLVLRTVTGTSLALPVYLALAALIPAARQVESVGDVQASISLGMMMPLLLLAGPATTPLILPIAVIAALADPDGRRDPRAFFAMVLVAVLPSLIVALGVVGFAMQANVDPQELLLPYVAAYQPGAALGVRELLFLAAYVPVFVVPLGWCCFNRHAGARGSAIAVVVLPLYLVVGGLLFDWHVPSWAPALALLATFASWLTVTNLGPRMRGLATIVLLITSALSWVLPPLWHDEAWRSVLAGLLPRLSG